MHKLRAVDSRIRRLGARAASSNLARPHKVAPAGRAGDPPRAVEAGAVARCAPTITSTDGWRPEG